MHSAAIDEQIIKKILQEYELGKFQSIHELDAGYANRSFKLETETGPYLFRWVLEKGRKDLQSELDLLEYISGYDFKTSYPVAKVDGNYLTELTPGYAVIYDFIKGEHPTLSTEAASQIGACVGQLSSISPPALFSRSNTINLKACLELSERLPGAPVKLPDIYDYFTRVNETFQDRLSVELPQGLIHADVFPDNTLFHENELQAVIDFEEVCTDTLLFDLAMTINGFCFPGNTISLDYLGSLIRAYDQKRKLAEGEWETLPLYIAWTAHGMLSWHLSRLSLKHSQRQEVRVRELMERVIDLLDRKEELSHFITTIR